MDTGASHHVCHDHAQFKNYPEADDKKVLLKNSHTTIVVGRVKLRLSFLLQDFHP